MPSMGKSIKNRSSVTVVGLDVAQSLYALGPLADLIDVEIGVALVFLV
jgi:hypothetical protein